MVYQRESFAQGLPIDHERQIDGHLHGRTSPVGAYVLNPFAHLVEQRLNLGQIGCSASHKSQQFAFLGRADTAAHRTLQIGATNRLHSQSQLRRFCGADGAHVNEGDVFDGTRQKAVCACINIIDGRFVGEQCDDGVNRLGQQFGRTGPLRACTQECAGFVCRSIPHRDRITQAQQT